MTPPPSGERSGKRAEQAAELDRLRTAMEEVARAGPGGGRVARLAEEHPRMLRGGADKLFDALPETAAQAAREADGARVQRVVSLLTHIETLQAGIHPAQEILDTGAGARRRVDVVYLGSGPRVCRLFRQHPGRRASRAPPAGSGPRDRGRRGDPERGGDARAGNRRLCAAAVWAGAAAAP
ncbi:MAG: hypothetical protein U1F87_18115 [Kiritimatiellia bacterium]